MCQLPINNTNEIYAVIIGATIGFIGTYFVSTKLFNKQRSLEAASKFREAFAEEIAKCKSSGDFKIKNVLTDFRKTWKKYCELNHYSPINDLVPEAGINNEGYIRELSETEQRENSLSFLNQLIKYAPVK